MGKKRKLWWIVGGSGHGILIVVCALILVVGGFLVLDLPRRVTHEHGPASYNKVQADLKTLETVVETFRLDTGRYPTTEEGLEALAERPADIEGWAGPYMNRDIPPDPWGNEYVYEKRGDDYRLLSYGADGEEGGDGLDADVNSRSE